MPWPVVVLECFVRRALTATVTKEYSWDEVISVTDWKWGFKQWCLSCRQQNIYALSPCFAHSAPQPHFRSYDPYWPSLWRTVDGFGGEPHEGVRACGCPCRRRKATRPTGCPTPPSRTWARKCSSARTLSTPDPVAWTWAPPPRTRPCRPARRWTAWGPPSTCWSASRRACSPATARPAAAQVGRSSTPHLFLSPLADPNCGGRTEMRECFLLTVFCSCTVFAVVRDVVWLSGEVCWCCAKEDRCEMWCDCQGKCVGVVPRRIWCCSSHFHSCGGVTGGLRESTVSAWCVYPVFVVGLLFVGMVEWSYRPVSGLLFCSLVDVWHQSYVVDSLCIALRISLVAVKCTCESSWLCLVSDLTVMSSLFWPHWLPCPAFPCCALPCLPLLCPALPSLVVPCPAFPCCALPCLPLLCPALPSLVVPCPAFPCCALTCLPFTPCDLPCLPLLCPALPSLVVPCPAFPCCALPCLPLLCPDLSSLHALWPALSSLVVPCPAFPCCALPCLPLLCPDLSSLHALWPALSSLVVPWPVFPCCALTCLPLLCPDLSSFVVPWPVFPCDLPCLPLWPALPSLVVPCIVFPCCALNCLPLCPVLSSLVVPCPVFLCCALSCFPMLCPDLSSYVVPWPVFLCCALTCLPMLCPVLCSALSSFVMPCTVFPCALSCLPLCPALSSYVMPCPVFPCAQPCLPELLWCAYI